MVKIIAAHSQQQIRKSCGVEEDKEDEGEGEFEVHRGVTTERDERIIREKENGRKKGEEGKIESAEEFHNLIIAYLRFLAR